MAEDPRDPAAGASADTRVPAGVWSGSLALGAGRLVGSAATALELVFAAHLLSGAAFGRWTFLLALLLLVESLSDLGTGAAALQRGAGDASAFRAALAGVRRARCWTSAAAAGLLFAVGFALDEDPRWLAAACILPASRVLESSGLVFQRALDWAPIVGARAVGAIARGVLVPLLLLNGVRDVALLLAAHALGLALGNVLVHLAARTRGLLARGSEAPLALWSLALPLGLASLAHQTALYADNWILRALRNEVELGHYNAAARIASFLLLFAANAGLVALPWLVHKQQKGQLGAATAGLSRKLLLPAAVVLGLLAPQADLVLRGAFGRPFDQASGSLQVLLVAALVVNATAGWLTALVASGAGRAVLALTLGALAANVLGNFALVPRFGGVGAATATLGTELLLSGGAWMALRNRGQAPHVPARVWSTGAAAFVLAAVASTAVRGLITSLRTVSL